MTIKNKTNIIILSIVLVLSLGIFLIIKVSFFDKTEIDEPIKNVIKYYGGGTNVPKLAVATTIPIKTTLNVPIDEKKVYEEEELVEDVETVQAPEIIDDGSIIYEGMTMTELTNKLNKSLNDYLANTGYYFAKYTRDTGMDPYLSVAIVLLETGCKWKCSSLTYECNNIGGLKGGKSCNGKSYSRYDTLEEGIDSYLNIIYNNYYLKGLDTPEKMGPKYAYSTAWAEKVNNYIKEIREK